MAKKLGFALGAGGSRGAAHIGFLKAMEESGIKPDFIAGASIGSVVGGCYATGMTPDELLNELKKFKVSELIDLSANPLGAGGLLRSKKLRKKLATYLKDGTFNQTKIPFCCVATDLYTGEAKVFSGEEKMLDGVVASSSIPSVFKPVSYKDHLLVDGGLVSRVPIQEVRDMGAQVVVGVDVLGQVRKVVKRFSMLPVLLRTFDIMDAQVTRYKVKELKPDLFLEVDLGDMSQYKLKEIDMAYKQGYELGMANATKIKNLIKE